MQCLPVFATITGLGSFTSLVSAQANPKLPAMISAIAGTVETNLDFMASPSRATRYSASPPGQDHPRTRCTDIRWY